MFEVDFRKVFYNLIPHFLRSTAQLAWLDSLQKPLKALNDTFSKFRNYYNYRFLFTAQTIYLEHYLNDKFDQLTRGIFIANLEQTDFTFVYNKIEVKPAFYFYNKAEAKPPYYLYNWDELLTGDTFVINVPVAVSFTETNMRAEVDFYNNAGRNYSIITY